LAPPRYWPPAIRTWPLVSKVAVCKNRTLDIDPVELNEPVAGSYSSADASQVVLIEPSVPPVIRTLPLASKVAVCPTRAVDMDPVELNELVAGSYSSADSKPKPPRPPVIRTLPLASKVAVWQHRALDMDPIELNEPWGDEVSVGVGTDASISVTVDVVVAAAVGL
jgi:hypothetical protein